MNRLLFPTQALFRSSTWAKVSNAATRFTSALLFFLALTSVGASAIAEDASGFMTTQSLRGTSWSGHFGAIVSGGNISIQFSPKLSSDGSLQYMHQVQGGGVLATVLGPFDKACPFTPRTLTIVPGKTAGTLAGTIQKYKCAKTQLEENQLAANGRGAPQATIPVDSVTLSPDGKGIVIVAKILGTHVTYTLNRNATTQPSTAATAGAATVPATVRKPIAQ